MLNTRQTIRIFKVGDNFTRTREGCVGNIGVSVIVLVLVKTYHGLPRRKMRKI